MERDKISELCPAEDRKIIAFEHDGSIFIIDKKSKKIVHEIINEKEESQFYETMAWTKDGKRLWIKGSSGDWGFSGPGVFDGKNVKWFDYLVIHDEYWLEPEKGWLVRSNLPVFGDAETHIEWKKKKPLTKLELVELATGKSVTIANAKGNEFRPRFDSEGTLHYKIGKKSLKLEPSEIAAKLVKTSEKAKKMIDSAVGD